ncbi:hypothetical protein V6N13_014180 [Hibiscus sabdariffa]
MLIFLIASGLTQVSIVSAKRESIETLLGNKPSPPEPYVSPFGWSDVLEYLSGPCEPFITRKDPDPSPTCCEGAKHLVRKTKIKRDGQELCWLMRATLMKFLPGAYDPKRLPLLGKKCHIKFYFPPVTDDIDCYKI